eukprot:7391867-Prymnesium_polylepis.4
MAALVRPLSGPPCTQPGLYSRACLCVLLSRMALCSVPRKSWVQALHGRSTADSRTDYGRVTYSDQDIRGPGRTAMAESSLKPRTVHMCLARGRTLSDL